MGKRGPRPSGAQPISIRLLPSVREKLDALAEDAGRPLSEIINRTLERALADEERIERRFGSRENYRLMQVIGIAIDRVKEEMGGRLWLHDPEVFELTSSAIIRALSGIKPDGAREPSENLHYSKAKEVARGVWTTITESRDNPLPDRARQILTELGEIPSRATVYRGEYDERVRLKVREVDRRLLTDKPTTEASEGEHSGFGLKLGAMIQEAMDEVQREMIAEGKDPRLSDEDTF